MKILHCADIHIGANRRFPNYLDRYRAATTEINSVCLAYDVDLMVVAGDLFHLTNLTLEEKGLVTSWLGSCPVPVALTYGNHEYIGPGYENNSLQWLISLQDRIPEMRMWNRPSTTLWKDVWWIVVPHRRWTTHDFKLVVQHLLSKIPRDTSRPVIGIAHEFFAGADTGAPTPAHVREQRCRLPNFKRINYWALGDIHKQQQLADNAWYCGSPLQTKFDERLPKGVLVVDMRHPQPNFVRLTSPTPLVELRGVPLAWPDAYVKLWCKPRDVPAVLPDNVVSVNPLVDDQDDEDEAVPHATHNVLGGMKSYLKRRGLSDAEADRALGLCRKLVKKVA